MSPKKTPQTMKASTAAKKLGVYLPATPQDFQDATITREEFDAMQSNPPQWLADLRRNGPHPRPVVAARLGISIAGLARGGYMDPLTTEQINEIREEDSTWLQEERARAELVRAEEDRLKQRAKPAPDAKASPATQKKPTNPAN